MTNEERIILSKNRIYEASLREFSLKGYKGGSVNNITKNGIPKGLLYHIYKSKDEIYLACVERCYQEFQDAIDMQEKDINLEKYMLARKNFLDANPEKAAVIFETMYPISEQIDKEIRRIREPFDSYNRECFEHIMDSLHLRAGVSKELAVNFFRMIQMMFHTWDRENSISSYTEYESSIKQVIDLILYGIAEA